MDKLTVVIAEVDDFTYGYGWMPSKRSVTIYLTPEQKKLLMLRKQEYIAEYFFEKAQEEK